MVDKNFNIQYLKDNYKELFNNYKKSWEQIELGLAINMKKAYYNLLCENISSGNMIPIFDLIKDIGSRLTMLCPENKKESFKQKFNDDYILNLIINCEFNFNEDLIKYIYFMIDFIILMDAPVNDENNKIWKTETIKLCKDNFSINFPLILLQIQEHIDVIIELVSSNTKF